MAGLPRHGVSLLQGAARAIRDGDAQAARTLLDRVFAEAPEHPEALRVLGVLYNRQERWTDALDVHRRALAQRPDDTLILSGMGTALTGAGQPEEGLHCWRQACALEQDQPMLWFNLGRNLQLAGHTDEAAVALEKAVSLAPGALPAHVLLGDARVHLGQFEAARRSYHQALALNPACGDAWRGLASMKTLPLTDLELTTLFAQHARRDVPPLDRIAMGFSLGKALEDRGRYPEAFAALEDANAQTRALGTWNAEGFSRYVDLVVAQSLPISETAPQGLGAEVIFVVSLPRSGSTLVEQILAAHPLVEGASELTDLEWVLQEESRRRGVAFPEWLPAMRSEDFARLGEAYLARTAVWRARRPKHTDKMPENWLHAGVLRAMLPGAAIVDVRRDPLEVGWSCFKQQFYRIPHFSNSFPDIAAYLRDHDRAMDAFARAKGARIRVQGYEALVADAEGEVRALLAFCGLPFDAGCLSFYRVERSVRTASAAQVRQPLRSDTARSHRYGALLDPLREALGGPRTT